MQIILFLNISVINSDWILTNNAYLVINRQLLKLYTRILMTEQNTYQLIYHFTAIKAIDFGIHKV